MNYKEEAGQLYRASEKLWICPYDESHLVLPAKFSGHVTRCSRNHPHINLERCFYNSNHYVKKSKMRQHLRECEDKANYDRTHPEGQIDILKLQDLGVRAVKDNSEDFWEEDWSSENTLEQSSGSCVRSPEHRQYREAYNIRTPDVQSTLNWQPGGSSNIARVDAEEWCDENDQTRHCIGEYFETSTPLSQGKSDSLITHTSYDYSPQYRSMGGTHVLGTGNSSFYSPSQPFKSGVPATTVPMPMGETSNLSILTSAQSGLGDTSVAAAGPGQISGIYRLYEGETSSLGSSEAAPVALEVGAILAQGSGKNTAGRTTGAHGKVECIGSASPTRWSTPSAIISPGSATSASTGEGSDNFEQAIRYMNPDTQRSLIKEKRFLEKKILGIEKLEKKAVSGQKLTEEEIVKVRKKGDYEEQLANLLEGVGLDG